MKSVNELHKFVLLANGDIKNAYRDKGKNCLSEVIETNDSYSALERAKEEFYEAIPDSRFNKRG